MKIDNFSTDGVCDAMYFQCLCSGPVFWCVCGLICLTSWLFFMVSICELFQTSFLEYCCYFYFFCNSSPVTTRGLDLFSGTYLNKLSVSMVPSD